MSFYALGFVIAAGLYLALVMRNKNKSITSLRLAIAVTVGLFSWFGVIIVLAFMSVIGKD